MKRLPMLPILPIVAVPALMLAAISARAEVLEIRQIAGGMECAECARNLRLEVSRLPGVDAATTSWNRRMLTVRFLRGSNATLADVRDIIRRHHFVPGEAEIVVAGRLQRDARGGLFLDGGVAGARYRLDFGREAPATPDGGEVLVTGRVAGERREGVHPGPPPPLAVLDLRPAP